MDKENAVDLYKNVIQSCFLLLIFKLMFKGVSQCRPTIQPLPLLSFAPSPHTPHFSTAFNVQYKSNWKCHYESPPYNEYTLTKNLLKCYLVIKNNEILIHVITCMNLEKIIVSEKSLT
jgi:hypothetical protein